MELIANLGDLDDEFYSEKSVENTGLNFSESSLIPSVGFYLGLDISELSSGVCMYSNGEKLSANISLESKPGDFYEVRLRRELKECLMEVVTGIEFDLIIIEDAFQGVNPLVTRKLYAINTAIDELILDGICKCKNFRRVNNQQWKSWLYTIDTEGKFKGLFDKVRIQRCLELLGVYEDETIEGWQDRLDSCGMLLGYMLCKDKADEYEERKKKKLVSLSDIRVSYQTEPEFCLEDAGYGYRDIETMCIEDKRMSKQLIIDCLSDYPTRVFITSERVLLGLFARVFNIELLGEDGGYFAFWVDEKAIQKYTK